MFPWLQKLSIHTPRKVTGNSKGSGVPKGRGGGRGSKPKKTFCGKIWKFSGTAQLFQLCRVRFY